MAWVKCHFMFIYRLTTLKAVVVFGGTYYDVYDKSKHYEINPVGYYTYTNSDLIYTELEVRSAY